MSSRSRSPDCLKNLSSRILSVEDQNVLYRGLKHHILPRKVQPDQVKAEVEKLVNAVIIDETKSVITKDQVATQLHSGVQTRSQTIRNERNVLDPVAQKEKFREAIVNVTNEKITAEFRDDIQGVFRAFMQSCKNICSSHVNRAFHSAISDISQNKDIVCVCELRQR